MDTRLNLNSRCYIQNELDAQFVTHYLFFSSKPTTLDSPDCTKAHLSPNIYTIVSTSDQFIQLIKSRGKKISFGYLPEEQLLKINKKTFSEYLIVF